MAKVTGKLQLTVPKAIADQYGIRSGDEFEWVPAGDAILVIPTSSQPRAHRRSVEERLRLFDQATARQRRREARGSQLRSQQSAPGSLTRLSVAGDARTFMIVATLVDR
jgi:AbrB family looped-hinge helix DNA binding protein